MHHDLHRGPVRCVVGAVLTRVNLQTNVVATGRLVSRAENTCHRCILLLACCGGRDVAPAPGLGPRPQRRGAARTYAFAGRCGQSKFWFPFGVFTAMAMARRTPRLHRGSGGAVCLCVAVACCRCWLKVVWRSLMSSGRSPPHMLEPVLDLFAHLKPTHANQRCSCGCHAAEVLNLLHKSQVMLVEGRALPGTAAHGQRGRHPDRRQLLRQVHGRCLWCRASALMAPRRGPPPRSVRRTARSWAEGLAEGSFSRTSSTSWRSRVNSRSR